ncbi:MAG: hypothetical protein PWP76_118 [Candidatus Diapherotrites archaeon]|nr:hypothetical protein [Candidatus Diapherotrites archaeon]MDN5366984.1 hypothetical protein [Candidatus Diapherotrites archaeon]
MPRGIITSSFRGREGTEYVIFDGEKYYRAVSRERFRTGDSVELRDGKLFSLSESVRPKVKERFLSGLKVDLELPDEIAFLRGNFEVLWKELAFLKVTGETPQVFYDNDADGIIAALLIKKALGLSDRAFSTISHWTLREAQIWLSDAPLYLLLDVGSDWRDRPGLFLLSSYGPTFVVDHHYAEKQHGFGVVINPALHSPELSKYNTATLVSYLVKSWVEKPEWGRIAAAGDKSSVIEWGEEDRKKALALEMSQAIRADLRLAEQILETDLWKTYYELFRMKVEMALENAEMEEKEINGKRALIVKLSYTPNYPHKGKIASCLMDERGYDIVIVTDAEKSFRYTVTMRGKGDLLSMVKNLGAAEYWGHPNAVSLSTTEPERVIQQILERL